jgi:hypothetical protein
VPGTFPNGQGAISHLKMLVRDLGDSPVVRGNDNSGLAPPVQVMKQADYLFSGCGIKLSSGFVGKYHFGVIRNSSRYRYSLHLPNAQLFWAMSQSIS